MIWSFPWSVLHSLIKLSFSLAEHMTFSSFLRFFNKKAFTALFRTEKNKQKPQTKQKQTNKDPKQNKQKTHPNKRKSRTTLRKIKRKITLSTKYFLVYSAQWRTFFVRAILLQKVWTIKCLITFSSPVQYFIHAAQWPEEVPNKSQHHKIS